MRLTTILFLLMSFVGFSQSDEIIGTLSITSSSGTAPSWTIAGVYGSATGFSGTDVQVGHRIVVRYVLGVTHSRNIYQITAVNSAGATNLNVDATRVEGTAVTTFPAGTHAVTSLLNNLLYDVPNISQQLESYINNYNLKSLDSADVGSTTLRNDSLFMVTSGGTEFYSGTEASGSTSHDALSLGVVTVKSDRTGSGSATVLTTTGAGLYTLTVQSSAHMLNATVFGNDTVLNGSNEMVLTVTNAANSFDRRFVVQLYNATGDGLVDQQATATNHTQSVSGNITTITIPGLNGFGSNGFYIELR